MIGEVKALDRLKIGYPIHRFPYRTETFVVRELFWLTKVGRPVLIYPLLARAHDVSSDQVSELWHLVRRGGRVFDSYRAQAHFLLHSPRRYFEALSKLLWLTYREPAVMIRAMALFPRTVSIAREVEAEEIRHLHAHFVWLEAIAASVIRTLVGVTYSVEPHAFGLFGRPSRSVARQLEDADGVVTISDYNRRFIRGLSSKLGQSRIEVVHCGVEPDVFIPKPSLRAGASLRAGGLPRAPASASTKAAAEPSPSNGPLRILSVGRAIEKKGHEYLIEACAFLRAWGYNFTCEIVTGATNNPPNLEKMILALGLENIVTLQGALNTQELVIRYQSSDVFALASVIAAGGDRDGIPVSLMEAMACGLPVVTTGVSGIPELVEHNETGLICEPRDPKSLAHALETLLQDRQLRERLGRVARTKVVAEFNAEKSAIELDRFFKGFNR